MTKFSFSAIGGIVAAAMLATQPAAAADDYYKDKTIRFVVGFGAGGGYDTYSRLLAPYLEKELGATVLVENLPGAGGLRALNRFYRAPGDGLQLTIVNGAGAAMQQLLDMKGVRFDLTELKYLGIIDYSRWLFLVTPDSPFKTLKDMMHAARTLSFGGSGKISGMSDGAAMGCYTVKMECKVVAGYKGSRAVALAVAQGEMDGMYVSETSAYRYTKAGNVRPVVTWNRKRSTLFPNLPTVFEQVKLNKEQAWWVDYRATVEGLGRVLVMPPSTPAARVATMRATVHKLLTDPSVVAAFEKRKRYVKYIPAEEAEKMVKRVLKSITPEQKAEIRKVVLE